MLYGGSSDMAEGYAIGVREAAGDQALAHARTWRANMAANSLRAQLYANAVQNQDIRQRLSDAIEVIKAYDEENLALCSHLTECVEAGKGLQQENQALREFIAKLQTYIQQQSEILDRERRILTYYQKLMPNGENVDF